MSSNSKPKVAFYWCASCGGCEEAVVDLAEKILDVAAAVDIVFWPVAIDGKKKDVEAMADGEITVSFINGSVRLSEQEEMAKLLRRKSKVVIAFGACAQLGGIPGLGNVADKKSIFEWVYKNAPSVTNPEGVLPQTHNKVGSHEMELPEFWDNVYPLDHIIDVDYYIPGCPPIPGLLAKAVEALLSGKLPPKGTVIAGDKALCAECALNDTKPDQIKIQKFKRPFEVIIDRTKCYLTQGLVCMGPVTRGGCDAQCVKGGMPCTGCFGPLDRTVDYGAKAVAAYAAQLESNDPAPIKDGLEGIPDPLGTFYRYSLPTSLLVRKIGK
jgi:F420-non-reducing hydrogenase small subunit